MSENFFLWKMKMEMKNLLLVICVPSLTNGHLFAGEAIKRPGSQSPTRSKAPTPPASSSSPAHAASALAAGASPPSAAASAASVNKDIPPELIGVSVKELVKVIGESRANGNGVTPPGTPGTPRKSRSPASPQVSSRGSSPSSVRLTAQRERPSKSPVSGNKVTFSWPRFPTYKNQCNYVQNF